MYHRLNAYFISDKLMFLRIFSDFIGIYSYLFVYILVNQALFQSSILLAIVFNDWELLNVSLNLVPK